MVSRPPIDQKKSFQSVDLSTGVRRFDRGKTLQTLSASENRNFSSLKPRSGDLADQVQVSSLIGKKLIRTCGKFSAELSAL